MFLRDTAPRALAAAGAVIGWATLALQFVLTVKLFQDSGGSPIMAAWRYVGYFTLLTNILVAIGLTYAAVFYASREGLGSACFELATATSIVMVGLVYLLLLRAQWNPQGAQKLADTLEHEVMPALSLVYFLLRRRSRLGAVDALFALIFPLAYVIYALMRGEADGWYAYWFLDRSQLTASQLGLNMLGLAVAFLAMAGALVVASNRFNTERAA